MWHGPGELFPSTFALTTIKVMSILRGSKPIHEVVKALRPTMCEHVREVAQAACEQNVRQQKSKRIPRSTETQQSNVPQDSNRNKRRTHAVPVPVLNHIILDCVPLETSG